PPPATAASTSATTTPTIAHGVRLAGSAAATLELEGPAATVPLAESAIAVAELDGAGMVTGIAEVAATGFPALLTGIPSSAAAATGLRLESVSRFRRCSSARISDACW